MRVEDIDTLYDECYNQGRRMIASKIQAYERCMVEEKGNNHTQKRASVSIEVVCYRAQSMDFEGQGLWWAND